MLSSLVVFFLWLVLGYVLWWGWFVWLGIWDDRSEISVDDASGLLSEYSTGTLDQEWFSRLWLWRDKRFGILEYCGHNQEYCQQAHKEGLDDEMNILMFGDPAVEYVRLPFVSTLEPEDTLSWLGIWCAEGDDMIDELHDEFYAQPPQSVEEVLMAGVRLWLWQDFSDCVINGSAHVSIAQSMQKAVEYFDVSKTPSYVLIDNRSWHRALIPWLYSLAEIGEVMTREFDFEGLE